jgi:alpha,alpha-trehalase
MQVAEQELNSYWLGDNKLESHLFDDGFVRYRDHYMNHITAEHESGWDMTSRFRDRCLDFAPVDLNCLIYKYENDLALYYEDKKDEKKAIHYRRRANHRKAMINQFMWDEKEGFFFDFNEETKKRSDFYSLAGFFPLWIGIVDEEKAEKVREKLVFFEYEGGLVTTQQNSISPEGRQWDWPNGWAPLQLIAVEGLMNYGFEEDAKRVAEKWVKLIEKFYRKNGKIYEKYNVVDGEMAKSERYQNQDGFGWTNAVFLCFVKMFALELDKKNIATVK